MGERNKRKAEGRSLITTREESQRRKVHFIFQAPEANEVYLAGEFNGWHTQTMPMIKAENGVWKAAMELNVGLYEYKLFVDGAWMEDRSCELCVEIASGKLDLESEPVLNSYGTTNFVFWT